MREIKFRAWDKTENRMARNVEELKFNSKGLYAVVLNHMGFEFKRRTMDVELMQYTGLKDKNGKEIYEGDIIRTHFSFSHEVVQEPFIIQFGVYIGSFCAKPAKKQELLVEEKVLTDSFIRSLSREAAKVIRSNDVKIMQDLRKDYSRAVREAQHEHAENARIRHEMLIMKRFLKKIYGEDWEEIVHKEVVNEA